MRAVREESLHWLLICNKRQLEQTLPIYIDHYDRQRPHRALALAAPDPPGELIAVPHAVAAHMRRRDRLSGPLHEYQRAA